MSLCLFYSILSLSLSLDNIFLYISFFVGLDLFNQILYIVQYTSIYLYVFSMMFLSKIISSIYQQSDVTWGIF